MVNAVEQTPCQKQRGDVLCGNPHNRPICYFVIDNNDDKTIIRGVIRKRSKQKGEKKMSANTSPTIEQTIINGFTVEPQDFVRFIYNSTIRVGVVHKITERNLIVETQNGIRSFTIEKILDEPNSIVKLRGGNISFNGVNWTSQGE
jgi:lipopolysaccharide export LptBFGC system permease protein LptF